MRKVLFIALALIVILALAGCNVAPSVPGVTPYTGTTGPYNGTSPGTYGNFAGGMYGNNAGGNNVGGLFGGSRNRQVIGNNRNVGNVGANGAYVFGGNAYGLR